MPGSFGELFPYGAAHIIDRSGFAYLTPAVLEGRRMACVSIGAIATERQDVAALWQERGDRAPYPSPRR